MSMNMFAFLYVIRCGEGTSGYNGYRMKFGGSLISSFDDHPREVIERPMQGKMYKSSAAGAYQFLSSTWDDCKKALDLPDFSPCCQDKAAIFLITRAGALAAVEKGDLEYAIRLCNKTWASLPGSPYGQPVSSFEQAKARFQQAGGKYIGDNNE